MPQHTHRVLIVEDDYAFRWSLAMRCQRRHIDADVAESLPEAHDLVRKPADYCGIALDLRLGHGDGTSLLDTIAERATTPTVVIVTAYPDEWKRMAAADPKKAALVSATIIKPADVDAVIDATICYRS